MREELRHFHSKLPSTLKNTIVTAFFLTSAYAVSSILLDHTGQENNSALVFTLAVACISLLSTGYVPGIIASVLSALAINIFFMYPFGRFNVTLTGYPVAFLSFLCIACIVSALTSRNKLQKTEAIHRELRTKALYEQNRKLTQEKNRIELEAAQEAIRTNILRSVSHDLRTPLTAISGAASVLMEDEAVQHAQNAYLIQDIKENADWLTAMVENLLSVTRIRQEDMRLHKVPEVLEEVAGDALMKTRKRFPNCSITLNLPEELIILPMEPILITQVIVNLLENAIRHSGDLEHIELSLYQEENHAVVTVSDRGRGIPPQTLEDINQGKELPLSGDSDASRGMGIGLSACRSIISAHSGSFSAENRPDGGALFRFELPMETEGSYHDG
ncbi:MAG: DUF4118 domain-containing protein [Oscillospiraceae bacterium]|nr:DUF4118 domain-containing protein [Oscillospiraceae bacterium]